MNSDILSAMLIGIFSGWIAGASFLFPNALLNKADKYFLTKSIVISFLVLIFILLIVLLLIYCKII